MQTLLYPKIMQCCGEFLCNSISTHFALLFTYVRVWTLWKLGSIKNVNAVGSMPLDDLDASLDLFLVVVVAFSICIHISWIQILLLYHSMAKKNTQYSVRLFSLRLFWDRCSSLCPIYIFQFFWLVFCIFWKSKYCTCKRRYYITHNARKKNAATYCCFLVHLVALFTKRKKNEVWNASGEWFVCM